MKPSHQTQVVIVRDGINVQISWNKGKIQFTGSIDEKKFTAWKKSFFKGDIMQQVSQLITAAAARVPEAPPGSTPRCFDWGTKRTTRGKKTSTK